MCRSGGAIAVGGHPISDRPHLCIPIALREGIMAEAMGKPEPRFRAKYVIFAFIAAMAAYVLYHNESFLINAAHPVWHHYEPFKWWLLPHGVAGACALILAPMQFWERLRLRFTNFLMSRRAQHVRLPSRPLSMRFS
jgi:hypothetical protein